MVIGFDAAKNESNIAKHGVPLTAAENFDFTTASINVDDREDYGEVRYQAIGFLNAVLYVFVYTIRNKAVRAISLRKATKREARLYAEEF